ncbi:MAG: hypothetical protein IPM38_06885 [Ignavibacteria bacterium]|nr:hypothetical protein [Ignavibacteria bacterium]MBK9333007.1 hypothetical protein [Ignavibacteria bacterium]
MKKKIVLLTAMLLIAIASAFVINENLFSNQEEAPVFLLTVYKYGGGSTQSGVEVVMYNSNGGQVASGTTDHNGTYDFSSGSWPTDTYTIKAWYPPRPNDGQFGQTNQYYEGISVYPTITLGPNY